MIFTRRIINSKFSIQCIHPRINFKTNLKIIRPFASQTLLSRTDFQNHSTNELREELNKRGIVTRSKKKSILIDQLLEFERGRMIATPAQKAREGTTRLLKGGVTSQTDPNKPNQEASESSKSADQSTIVVSSPAANVVARLLSEPEVETPKSTPIQTGSNAASLGSPLVTVQTAGHNVVTWPASINIPVTPVEEPLGTAIPFIPDNWTSHQQSHAQQLVDIKPSPSDLQVSTAAHPSTLPEGGPSLIVTNQFSSNSTSTPTSTESNKLTEFNQNDIFSNILNSISSRSFLSSYLGELIFNQSNNSASQSARFQFEDRPLNERERTGLVQLLAFFGGSWILAGLVDRSQ